MQNDSELTQNDRKYVLPAMSTLNECERLLDKRGQGRVKRKAGFTYMYACKKEHSRTDRNRLEAALMHVGSVETGLTIDDSRKQTTGRIPLGSQIVHS